MDIFGIGIGEILVILVIAMIAVGPERMVKFAADAGRFLRQFRAVSDEMTREFREAFTFEMLEDETAVLDDKPAEAKPAAGSTTATTGTRVPAPSAAKPASPSTAATPRPVGQGSPAPTPASIAAMQAAERDQAGSGDAQQEEAPTTNAPEPATAESADQVSAEQTPAEETVPEPVAPYVPEPEDLSDILGSAFAFAEPEQASEESEPVAAEPAFAQPAASQQPEAPSVPSVPEPAAAEEPVPDAPTVVAPAAEAVPDDPDADAQAEEPAAAEVAEPVAADDVARQDGDQEDDDSGLNAPIPSFGFEFSLDGADEATDDLDASRKEG